MAETPSDNSWNEYVTDLEDEIRYNQARRARDEESANGLLGADEDSSINHLGEYGP